ncbi:MAG: hypothetical protein WHT07_12540 [Desulfobaccales bacterium]
MAISRLGFLLLPLMLVWACDQAKVKELEKDLQALKTEVAGLKEKLTQVEAGQQKLEAGLKELAQAKEAAPPAVIPAPVPSVAAPAPGVLTVEQLLKDKERYLNTRVVVRGTPGPVLMHKKIIYLTSPAGLLEVNFSQLPDKKQMERLTAQALETPLTVTGTLIQAPGVGKDTSRLQIMAEVVEF